jgi:hypothetical protein
LGEASYENGEEGKMRGEGIGVAVMERRRENQVGEMGLGSERKKKSRESR